MEAPCCRHASNARSSTARSPCFVTLISTSPRSSGTNALNSVGGVEVVTRNRAGDSDVPMYPTLAARRRSASTCASFVGPVFHAYITCGRGTATRTPGLTMAVDRPTYSWWTSITFPRGLVDMPPCCRTTNLGLSDWCAAFESAWIVGGGKASNHSNSLPSVTRHSCRVPSAATSAANSRAGDGGHSPRPRFPVLAVPSGSPRNVPWRNSTEIASTSCRALAKLSG